MSVEFYLIAALAVVITGISKSGFAGGLGVLAVPLMSLFVTPQVAVTVMMPVLLVMDCANIWKYRHSWSWDEVKTLLPGALGGIVLGVLTFQWMEPALLKLGIGVMALLFVAQFAYRRCIGHNPTGTYPAVTFALGGLSGFASFVAHAGGPPVKGYLLSRGMEKSLFVGTNSVFFFTMNLIKSVSYLALAQYTPETLTASLLLTPFLVLGVLVGFRLHHLLSQEVFTRVAYLFLTMAGVKLLWDGALVV